MKRTPTTQREPHVVIVGTGFGGLGMALELKRHGFENFTILEKRHEIGGVWRENTYPGAACDVPAPYYSYSYEPNPDWPSRFSRQDEILAYMRRVADSHHLDKHIRFGSEVTSANFDETTGRWRIGTSAGEQIVADVFVPATGQLSRPKLPDIEGIDAFDGPAFHSATWDHSVDLTGKRVAVIGTGASAIQFVPEIQPRVAHLTVFQRSAPWVLPRLEVTYSDFHRTLFRTLPVTLRVERFGFWLFMEVLSLALVDVKPIRPMVAALAKRHLRKQVPDPALRAKLTPDYEPGCKRGLFSGDYYPALGEPNVDVVTDGITRIEPAGVRTADGALHEADVIVYATGFKATDFLAPMDITGVGGQNLRDTWDKGAHAYLGIAVPDFPNMFMMYGPNTNLGVGSIIYMLESQARYIRQAVERIAKHGPGSWEVRRDVARSFDEKLQSRLERSVWTFCSSWYRNEHGRITNNWPGTVSAYRLATRRLDPSDYQVRRAA